MQEQCIHISGSNTFTENHIELSSDLSIGGMFSHIYEKFCEVFARAKMSATQVPEIRPQMIPNNQGSKSGRIDGVACHLVIELNIQYELGKKPVLKYGQIMSTGVGMKVFTMGISKAEIVSIDVEEIVGLQEASALKNDEVLPTMDFSKADIVSIDIEEIIGLYEAPGLDDDEVVVCNQTNDETQNDPSHVAVGILEGLETTSALATTAPDSPTALQPDEKEQTAISEPRSCTYCCELASCLAQELIIPDDGWKIGPWTDTTGMVLSGEGLLYLYTGGLRKAKRNKMKYNLQPMPGVPLQGIASWPRYQPKKQSPLRNEIVLEVGETISGTLQDALFTLCPEDQITEEDFKDTVAALEPISHRTTLVVGQPHPRPLPEIPHSPSLTMTFGSTVTMVVGRPRPSTAPRLPDS